MIKTIYNFESEQVTGGCEYGMNCPEFAIGDNITFKNNASFVDPDGQAVGIAKFLRGPNVTCTIAQLGKTSKHPIRKDNNHLLLGTCYDNGKKISSDILSWIPEDEVNKV